MRDPEAGGAGLPAAGGAERAAPGGAGGQPGPERDGRSPASPGGGPDPVADVGLGSLLRLGVRLGAGSVFGGDGFDAGAVGCRWAREAMGGDGPHPLDLGVAGRRVRLVGRRDDSALILGGRPGTGFGTGELKRSAMAVLAPRALTVSDGEAWARRRAFNERVLGTGATHPCAEPFLERVRRAFDRPVRDATDVRDAMRRAMVGIVLGDDEAGEAAREVERLFQAVQKPLRRKLLGFLHARRRRRLYDLLRDRWERTPEDDPTLLGLARGHAPEGSERDELLEQVPHWMFTFTGSGTDLLVRTLALVTARPGVRRRVIAEVDADAGDGEGDGRAGGVGGARSVAAVEGLRWVEACLLETGRLFPPVTRTFHRPLGPGSSRDAPEHVHWFPLLQRDPALGADVHHFRPERWLEAEPDAAAAASNLFLRGPRACPGRDLVLFVCAAALARQVGELRLKAARASRLTVDPLPISFPEPRPRFATVEER